MKMMSWVFREASGAPGGSRGAKMELAREFWVPFWLHFGIPFSPFRSLGLLSAGRFGQKGDLEGVKKRGQQRERKGDRNGAILGPISMPFSGPNREDAVFENVCLHEE